ncbi:MAG: 3-isopropylmalate dehydratase large subunit [Pseudomonadota bacterium]
MARTMFDKIWDAHVVADLGEGTALLHVDRHLLHDLSGGNGLDLLKARGLSVRSPHLTFAVPDHAVSTQPGRTDGSVDVSARLVPRLRTHTARHGIKLFDINDREQGIVHVIGPELGLSLPGLLIACGDSHTSTHGGIGAMAFGIGSTELMHVLATQTLVQKRPRTMRVTFTGMPGQGITPKDMILHLIGTLGASGGDGYAVEYAGDAIRALSIEGRLTVCNMSIEWGAKIGMVAPDDKTFAFLEGRPYAPKGPRWDEALSAWRTLRSDENAHFDRDETIDAARIEPQVTWGTSPEHTISVSARIPDPEDAPDATRRDAWTAALAYMGLKPGARIAGTPVDHVFIGSCTNGRLSDLEDAARVVSGKSCAPSVRAWVVPGSQQVSAQARAQGIDRIFTDAGFHWREPGCSMCVAANGETVPPGERAMSTTNRNFAGRQGPRARTHLASPAMAAAAAVAGCITDVRTSL